MDWVNQEQAIPVKRLLGVLPNSPGKYAFFVDQLDSLPALFRAEAKTRLIPNLLYVGKADISLHVRVWEQECQHLRPATLFRSVGAMLGFRSPMGGRNYEFAPVDKAKIVNWIAESLSVAWDTTPQPGSQRDGERVIIRHFAPLLNIQNNPAKFAELARLRGLCRAGLAERNTTGLPSDGRNRQT
jgi:hypothetical protein